MTSFSSPVARDFSRPLLHAVALIIAYAITALVSESVWALSDAARTIGVLAFTGWLVMVAGYSVLVMSGALHQTVTRSNGTFQVAILA